MGNNWEGKANLNTARLYPQCGSAVAAEEGRHRISPVGALAEFPGGARDEHTSVGADEEVGAVVASTHLATVEAVAESLLWAPLNRSYVREREYHVCMEALGYPSVCNPRAG